MSLTDALHGSDAPSRTRRAALVLALLLTIVLAATVAVYVLDSEDDGPMTTGVSTTVDDGNRTVTVAVDEIGDAESFVLRGDGIDGAEVLLGELRDSGDSVTLSAGETLADEGDVRVVMNDGDSEYTVSSVEWDWSNDDSHDPVTAAVDADADNDYS